MDDGRQGPVQATRLVAWVAAGLLTLGAVTAGVIVSRDDGASSDRVVSAAGGDASGVEVPTTVPPTTVPPTTAPPAPASTIPKPSTTAPPTTQAPRPTTTKPLVTTTTTPAGVRLTVVNSSPSAVSLVVNGRSFDLAPGAQVGPVPIVHAANGNDIIELRLKATPTCGMGDADNYFPSPGNYRLTITPVPKTCFIDATPIDSVTMRVTPA